MFKIKGRYLSYSTELIDEFDTLNEAEKMLAEYRMAYGAGWSLWIVR